MIVVVVSAASTSWVVVSAEPLKSASPEYVAVNVFAPADVDVSEHVPASTAAEQLSTPSDTVTGPSASPPPASSPSWSTTTS